MKPIFSVYLGEEKEGSFLGFIAENNLFLFLEVDFDKEKAREFLKDLSENIHNSSINNLVSFETFLTQAIHKVNFPLGFSLAAGYLFNNIFYLKTFNEGEIYIKRGGQLVKIISGNTSASGYIREDDFLIFANTYFNEILGGIESMKKIFDHKKPAEIIEGLIPEMKGKDDSRAIALLVCFEKEQNEFVETEQSEGNYVSEEPTEPLFKTNSFINRIKEDFYRLNNLPENYRKKRLTFIFVFIIFVILVWSVGLGYQRRQENKQIEKIKISRQLIEKKLKQANEEAFLNLTPALNYVTEAKTELAALKKTVNKKHQKEIEDINLLISSTEAKLLKKEKKNSQEFFDLAVENKDAQGTKLSLDKDNLLIIDEEKKTGYLLSLTKKSLEKKELPELKTGGLIAYYQDLIFIFVPGEGIYKIDQGKSKKIIENDKEWKEPISLRVYNGNIYLLDKGKDEIYKYLVAEEGYSSKQSYFVSGSAIDLSDAISMAIDGAVYINFSNYIAKYVSGIRDEFKISFPGENISLTTVFTDRDLEKVYAWDKDHGVIYVMAKNGSYEKQIDSSIISKATDFVVFENNIYLLVGQKIYKIEI